jgi:hypothetical protein
MIAQLPIIPHVRGDLIDFGVATRPRRFKEICCVGLNVGVAYATKMSLLRAWAPTC